LPRQKLHTSVSDAQYVDTEQQQQQKRQKTKMMITHTYKRKCMHITFVCVHKRVRYNYRARSRKRKLRDKICKKKRGKANRQIIIYFDKQRERRQTKEKKLITFVWLNMRKQRDEINRQLQQTVACA